MLGWSPAIPVEEPLLEKKLIVGSEEWCGFPALGIPAIKARVDSGAKTSCLHAYNIQAFKREGEPWVSFEAHPLQHQRRPSVRCEARLLDKRLVRSSSGESERRPVIRTAMSVGGSVWDIELTLANRDSMGYRMLLGREAMLGRMLVDPSEIFCLGEIPQSQLDEYYRDEHHIAGTGLRIGLLASNPDLYSNRRIMEAGTERGHRMSFLDIRQCYMKLDPSEPEVHYRDGRILNNLDAVIPRIRPSQTFYGCALTRHFASLDVFALNGSAAISQSRDKLFSLQLLQQSGLNIPTSGFANSPVETNELIEMVGGAPLVVKLLEGTQGRGVVLAETRKAGESVINAFKSLRPTCWCRSLSARLKARTCACLSLMGG